MRVRLRPPSRRTHSSGTSRSSAMPSRGSRARHALTPRARGRTPARSTRTSGMRPVLRQRTARFRRPSVRASGAAHSMRCVTTGKPRTCSDRPPRERRRSSRLFKLQPTATQASTQPARPRRSRRSRRRASTRHARRTRKPLGRRRRPHRRSRRRSSRPCSHRPFGSQTRRCSIHAPCRARSTRTRKPIRVSTSTTSPACFPTFLRPRGRACRSSSAK